MRILIYRWRCPECETTRGVLPDFLAPYLHHVTEVRESCILSYSEGSTVEQAAERVGIEVRTASRWLARVRRALDAAVSLLSNLVAELTTMVTWPKVKVEGTRGLMLLLFDLGDILCGSTVTCGAPGVFPTVNSSNLYYL